MYTAVIVEPRCHNALSFVLENILSNLDNSWNVIVIHGNNNFDFLQNIFLNKLNIFIDRVKFINLGVDNLTIKEYNTLLTSKKFYDFIPTDIFLLFQTDSIILSKNKHLINDFLEYDYVGAPWNHKPIKNERVGNGGFSIRNKKKMLEIIYKCPYKDNIPEDVYFCYQPDINIKKPDFEKAKLFSVEEVFSEITFGCHKPWGRDHTNNFFKLYPEAEILYKLQ